MYECEGVCIYGMSECMNVYTYSDSECFIMNVCV